MYSISVKNGNSFIEIQNEKKKVKDPVLYEALNSCGSLTFEAQIEDDIYDGYERLKSKVLVKEDGAIQFVGRLLRTTIDFQNTKKLVFEGEMALLNDVLYPPYQFSGSIAEFLTNVINYYNSKCSTENQINIGRITMVDKNNYIVRSNTDYSTCWEAINDKLINLCGGYLSMRWVLDGNTVYRYLDYLENPGAEASQKIEYAKNILDVGQEIDATDICTVLYPFGAKDENTGEKIDISSVNDGKKYITSNKISLFGIVEKTVDFEDVTLPSNLLSKARAYLEEHDSSITTLTVKAIDLHVLDDIYVRFNVGDTVHVYSKPNSIDTYMMISERTRNLNNPDKDELTLGKVIETFTSGVDKPGMNVESDENALNYVDVEYGLSDSPLIAPTVWSTESPVWTAGKYIWQRTKCVYLSGTITYSNVACIQGAKGEDGTPGADGANGKDGINGTNGKDGTSSYFFVRYSANADGSGMTTEPASNTKYMGVATNTVNSAPTSASSYKWSLIKGTDGTNGTPGADGSSSYLHIKYSNDGKTFTANSGEELGTWIGTLVDNTLADSTTFSDYTWKKYVGADGANGKDGINGTNGKDGTSSYFFVRYSANADGSGMTTEPASNTKYMGVATNTVNSAPTSASSYKWSLIKGTDGTNGTPGADGSSSYLHIKYSNDGKTFTANSGEELGTWIGTLVDNTLADSTTFSDYTWKKYVGADGANGKDGINGTNGKDGTSSYFFVRYSANADGSGMTTEPASNTKYMGVATNTVNSAPTSASSYKWSLIKGTDGTNGTPGADGSSSYLHIKYSNDGKTFTANSGEELGTWIGTLVDNTLADSTTFSDYTWKKYVGADGANGKDGINGTNGKDGTSSYFFVRYSANADGSGMTTEPASNTKYMGVATNTVNSAPTSASSYKWSLIKGTDGTNGTPGADGSSSYLHIKYSNDGKTFTANSGEELGTWIGTLVDNTLADSTTFSDYTWKKYVGADGANGKDGINGANGTDGTDGRGISSIVEQYYLSSSNTKQTGGSWVTTCPAWKKGYYIWTRSKITWLNPTEVTYTTPTLAGAINSANENANNAIESIPSDSHILDITKTQTRLLLGSNGGYMEVLKDSNEKPIALRFMDSMIASSAKNVLLINQNGIGFSNSGINGPFYNAWTIDGHLSADAIYTGILQDRVGNFKLNMDTGEISVKKLTLNTPDLIFGVYPSGNYIEVTEAESSDGILFKGTGKILMTPSGAFDVRNIVSNVLKNEFQISSAGASNNISLWNNLHSNAAYFANSITMGSQTQVDGTVNNAVNLYNYLVGSNTEANYISMSNDGSNKYLKINNDKSMNRLWLTRTGNNTHLQLANYSSNAGGNIYTNVLEFDSASGILMFNMDYGYPGSFERSSVTGMKMYGVDLNINSKDDMRLTASGLLYLNASADYVTKIWYNGQKLKKAVTISGDQIFISTRTMCFRVTGMTNGCLAVESVTNGTQSESSGGKYRFQTVNYTNFA